MGYSQSLTLLIIDIKIALSEATFERIRPLLAEAYDVAMKRYNKRKAH